MDELTPLQIVSEKIAADFLDVGDDEVRKAVKAGANIGGIYTGGFIEMLMAILAMLMESCPQSDDDLREVIKDPGFWQRVQLRRAVRRNVDGYGLRWRRRANDICDSCLKVGCAQQDEVIDAVIEQVRDLG